MFVQNFNHHQCPIHILFSISSQVFFIVISAMYSGTVVGPSEPVVAIVGDDTVLPCHLDPAVNAADMTVEWTRSDLTPKFVHVWRDGVELVNKKNEAYMERTSLPINNLKLGDISLKLSKVKLSDRGSYKCFIPTGIYRQEIIWLLMVVACEDSSKVVLQCESAGWYPEPELLWLDSEGNLLSAGPTETLRGPDDLYTVSSRVTVEKRHSNNITCRLQQRNTNQSESLTNSQPRMLAVIGHTQDITLPCSVNPPVNAVDEMVEWSRSDLNPRFVHVWRSGEDHLIGQNPSYKNRTSVSIEKLKTGDASLKLTKVRLSDEGTYRCFIPGLSADLSITKVSPGVLECKSKGWYPEPDVFWLESEGKIIPAGSKEMFRGPDDLYALSSRLTLEKGHSNNITCRIQQNKQHREDKIHVPVSFRFQSSSQHRNSFSESHK
uniref:Ig-like domain-containing protein n=1 Tax=Neolamprologus brichardi TaxID=32507 RepID=A0A3Q4IGZ6_NEOBR